MYIYLLLSLSYCLSDKNIGMISNITHKGLKETVKVTNAALLDGDLKTLEEFLYSNLTQARSISLIKSHYSLCLYYDTLFTGHNERRASQVLFCYRNDGCIKNDNQQWD